MRNPRPHPAESVTQHNPGKCSLRDRREFKSGFPVRGCRRICTKSGQQPVDGLHSIENTCGCRCQFFIDSKFGRSTNRHTRSPDNFLTHFNSNRSLGLQPLAAMRLTKEMNWRTGRGDSARRCPPQERTAGFLTVDRGRQDKPGFNQLQAATGPVAATLLSMTTLRQGIDVGCRPRMAVMIHLKLAATRLPAAGKIDRGSRRE
jgi:hypothetical protein